MKKRHLLSVFAVVLLALALCLTAFAADDTVIDWEATGSITLKLADSYDQTPVSDAKITLYQVAEAGSENSLLTYTYTKDFADCGLPLEDLNDEALPEKLAAFAAEKKLTGVTETTDKDGKLTFKEVPLGFYLLVQTGGAEGYSVCMPFTVAVPTSDSTQWIYDIEASPKTGIVKLTELTARKVWAGSEKHPESVTVQLKRNGEAFGDAVTLNAENNWTYTWKDLEARESWSVEEVAVPDGYKATYETKDTVVTITNTSKLPQTGQLNWPVPVLICVGLALFVVGWVLFFRRKKEKNA